MHTSGSQRQTPVAGSHLSPGAHAPSVQRVVQRLVVGSQNPSAGQLSSLHAQAPDFGSQASPASQITPAQSSMHWRSAPQTFGARQLPGLQAQTPVDGSQLSPAPQVTASHLSGKPASASGPSGSLGSPQEKTKSAARSRSACLAMRDSLGTGL